MTRFACSLPVSTSAPIQSEERAKKRRRSSISRLLLLRKPYSFPSIGTGNRSLDPMQLVVSRFRLRMVSEIIWIPLVMRIRNITH
uniref:Uncharacterized protein n=1 Tax=Solanum lycopersicum TaxID=4081 RepID=A0A3Q7H9Q6_SOLLC